MNVNDIRTKKKAEVFSDLDIGDTFMVGERLFLKTGDNAEMNDKYNAINLENNNRVYCVSYLEVQKVKCTITIEENWC